MPIIENARISYLWGHKTISIIGDVDQLDELAMAIQYEGGEAKRWKDGYLTIQVTKRHRRKRPGLLRRFWCEWLGALRDIWRAWRRRMFNHG